MHILLTDNHRISPILFGRGLRWSSSSPSCSKPGVNNDFWLNHT